MKNKLITITVLILVAFATACGRRGARADQQNYEVVEEGSATGVTSTIHGPGETVPPITNTNVDTTTAFTLDPNAVPPVTTIPPSPVIPRPQPPPAQTEPEPEPVEPPTQTDTAPPPPTQTQTDTAPPPTRTDTQEPPPPPPPPPPAG